MNLRIKFLLPFFSFLLALYSSNAQNISTTISVTTPPPFCVGANMEIDVELNGIVTFGLGNAFFVEFSDGSGNFSAQPITAALPPNIFSIAAPVFPSTISISVPDLPMGSGYKVRVVASNPSDTTSIYIGSNFTINPTPIVTLLTPISPICSEGQTNISLTASTALDLLNPYEWNFTANPNVNITAPGAANSNPISQTLQNITDPGPVGLIGSVTYTITAKSDNGCISPVLTVTQTVNPKPNITTSPSTPSAICSDDQTNINLTASTALDLLDPYTWDITAQPNVSVTIAGGANSNPISQTLHNTTDNLPVGLIGSITYTVTAKSDGGCISTVLTITQTVNPKPNVTTSPSTPDSICSDGQTNINLTASTALQIANPYIWGITAQPNVSVTAFGPANSNPIIQTLHNTTDNLSSASIGSVTYTITATSDNSCTSSAVTFTQIVKPRPKILSSDTTICSGDSLGIWLNTGNGGLFTWSLINAAPTTSVFFGASAHTTDSIPFADTIYNLTGSPEVIVYSFTPWFAGCSGDVFLRTVNVNPGPVVTASPSSLDTICSQSSTNISLTANTPVTVVTWSTANPTLVTVTNAGVPNSNPISQILQNSTVVGNTLGSIQYIVTATSASSCTSSLTLTQFVNPKPTLNLVSPDSICSGTSTNIPLSASTGTVDSFKWTVGNHMNVNDYDVSPNFATVSSIIDLLTDTSNTTLGFVHYIVTPKSAAGCEGNPDSIVQKVNPTPVLNIVTPGAICSGFSTSIPLSASTATIDSFKWVLGNQLNVNDGAISPNFSVVNSIVDLLTDTSNTDAGFVHYLITPKSAAGCEGNPDSIIQNVNPTPVITTSPPTPICSGDTTSIDLIASTDSLATFSWTVALPLDSVIHSLAVPSSASFIADTITNLSHYQNKTIQYVVTSTSAASCTGTSTITQTIKPIPNVTILTPDSICSGANTNIILSATTLIPSTFTWTIGNHDSVVGAIPNSIDTTGFIVNKLTDTTNYTQKTVDYIIVAKSAGCTGSSATISQRVNPTPKLIVTDSAICSRSIMNFTPHTTTSGISVFSWTVDPKTFKQSDIVPLNTSQSNNLGKITDRIISFPTLNVRDTLFYKYTIKSDKGCINTQSPIDTVTGDTFSLFINPTPDSLHIITPESVCNESSFQRFRVASKDDSTLLFELQDKEYLNWWAPTPSYQVYHHTDSTSIFALIRSVNTDTITVISQFVGFACPDTNSIIYTSIPTNKENPRLIMKAYPNGDAVMVCLANDIKKDFHYRWGRTRKIDLSETLFEKEQGQEYLFSLISPSILKVDTSNYFYWVEIIFLNEIQECERRIYLEGHEPNGKSVPNNPLFTSEQYLNLYPNPVQNNLTVELSGTMDGNFTIELLDITGKIVNRFNMSSSKTVIPVDELQTGCYLISCRKDGVRMSTQKFIKD